MKHYVRTILAVHVRVHPRENESRGRTYLPRPTHLISGNRQEFPFGRCLPLLVIGHGRLRQTSVQAERVGQVTFSIHSRQTQ